MMKAESQKELFFPYYVNQGRLLDIYAILNNGYSEYAEITTAINEEHTKGGQVDANGTGGFKLFNFGASASAQVNRKDAEQNEQKEKKVQTVTSALSIVKSTLEKRGYLKNILESKPGDFVCLSVVLKINSIKSLLTEASEILKLAENMQKIGAPVKGAGADTKKLNDMLKKIQVLFGGEEILFEDKQYAIIGNILDSHLYQANRIDIIGTNLVCLAQVKRVFPNGTQLMKNTMFTKIKDVAAKQQFIDEVSKLVDGDVFDFEATVVPSITDKPVYQLEIIALYQ